MIKRRWRELIKTFGSHVDPERSEQLKRNKAEIENSMARILKLIKNEDQGKKEGKRKASKKESELVGLIDNFYKEYQSLYALYDHLIGESAKIVFGRKLEKEVSFMSSSGSDSEYFSSEEVDVNTSSGKFENTTTNHQELEFATSHVTDLKHKLASISKEKEALAKEYNAALSKVQQAEITNKDLRSEMDQKEREIQALVQTHEAKGKQSVARKKELESQLTGLKTEMEALRSQKRDLEISSREGKAVKAKQKGDKNAELLHARVLELEAILKDKEDEKSALLLELEANENNSTSKIANLMAQVSNLQLEVDCLRDQKCEIEERLACKRSDASASAQIKVMQQELESLKLQKTELEMQLDEKTKEVSKNLIQIETLKEELAKKNIVTDKRLVEEGSYRSTQMKELELQVDTLRNQRDELEKQKTSKSHENNQLRLEKERLNANIVELEGSLSERGDETSALRIEYESGKKEASVQMMALTAQINALKQELDSMRTQKSQLALQSEKIIKLTGKIEDQQRNSIKEDQKDSSRKLSKDYKQTKGRLQQNRPNLQGAERKMEDLAEKCRNSFENNIRLLYQRILVAEQLHTENKENYRKTKRKYEKQNKELEETIATYEVDLKMMRDISESAGNALDGLGLAVNKFEEENDNFVNHISTISKELQIAKNWVKWTTSEIKRLKQNVDVLVAQLDDKEEQEFLLREKVWKLEAKVSKEGGEKLNLMKAMTQLEKKLVKYESLIKEKDERLVSLGDEKREAIRQLCILLDYQRSRYDHLKQIVSQLSLRCNNKTNT